MKVLTDNSPTRRLHGHLVTEHGLLAVGDLVRVRRARGRYRIRELVLDQPDGRLLHVTVWGPVSADPSTPDPDGAWRSFAPDRIRPSRKAARS